MYLRLILISVCSLCLILGMFLKNCVVFLIVIFKMLVIFLFL